MTRASDNDPSSWRAKQLTEFATKYPDLARQQQLQLSARTKLTIDNHVLLGRNEVVGEDLTLGEKLRLAHSHSIGTTGAGKTNHLAHLSTQDIDRGRGVLLLDPHGGDPATPRATDSLFSTILAHCERRGLVDTGRVHVIDPTRTTHATCFNPLTGMPGFESDVIADLMLEATERIWQEDTHEKPATRSTLRATFIALRELGLTLNEAYALYDPHDADGLRRHAIQAVKNPFARAELQRLQDDAQQRNRTQFDMRVEGAKNRLNDFMPNAALRAILTGTHNTLDLVEVMDRNEVLLVNLQPTGTIGSIALRLLGTLLLRYLFELAPRRVRRTPFFVYIDECQRYLTGDIPTLLAEVRKHRVGLHLAHQTMGHLAEAGPDILSAVTACTQIKSVFRMADGLEALDLVKRCFTVDYEKPVQLLVKPTAVGQEIMWLQSEQHGRSETDTTGQGETQTETHGRSRGEGETFSDMHAVSESEMTVESSASGFATIDATGSVDGLSQSILPDGSLFSPGMPSNVGTPTSNTLAISANRANSTSQAQSRNEMHGAATGRGHAETHATGYARSFSVSDMQAFAKALQRSRSHALGTSDTIGRSQAMANTFKDLPSAVHSVATVEKMLADTLRTLADGEAYVAIPRSQTRIQVPLLATPVLPPATLTALVTRVLESSRYATRRDLIDANTEERMRALIASGRSTLDEQSQQSQKPDPDSFHDVGPGHKTEADKLREKLKQPPLPPPPLPRGKKPDYLRVIKADNDDDDPKPAS